MARANKTKKIIVGDLYEMRYPLGIYLGDNLSKIDMMATALYEDLKNNKNRVNLICRGSSGSIIAAIVSSKLNTLGLDFVINHIKKEGEKSHSDNRFNHLETDILVFIDDFIVTGDTMNRMYDKVEEFSKYIATLDVEYIDYLVVSGFVETKKLKFRAKKIIAQEIK